ncbi:MAG: hypothetical protein ACREJJ_01535 [Candidatus Methylomirabilales bacterium]
MRTPRLLLPIGLILAAGLSIGPGAKRLEAAHAGGACAEVHAWVVTYVESFRGHLLRIIARDPLSPDNFPRVGYWITFPENWMAKKDHPRPIARGCQETPGGPYTVEVQTEKGDWIAGSRLLVNKLSADWRRISFTVLTDPDDPASVVIERVLEIPE